MFDHRKQETCNKTKRREKRKLEKAGQGSSMFKGRMRATREKIGFVGQKIWTCSIRILGHTGEGSGVQACSTGLKIHSKSRGVYIHQGPVARVAIQDCIIWVSMIYSTESIEGVVAWRWGIVKMKIEVRTEWNTRGRQWGRTKEKQWKEKTKMTVGAQAIHGTKTKTNLDPPIKVKGWRCEGGKNGQVVGAESLIQRMSDCWSGWCSANDTGDGSWGVDERQHE